jgi:hypothetical protein
MPSVTNITVNDREATPVAHVYTPQTRKGDVWYWARRDGTPLGDETLTMSIVQTAGGLYKVRLRMVDPVVVTETINGISVPKIERSNFVSSEFTFSERSSLQERKNIVGKFANAFATSQTFILNVVQDLEGIH